MVIIEERCGEPPPTPEEAELVAAELETLDEAEPVAVELESLGEDPDELEVSRPDEELTVTVELMVTVEVAVEVETTPLDEAEPVAVKLESLGEDPDELEVPKPDEELMVAVELETTSLDEELPVAVELEGTRLDEEPIVTVELLLIVVVMSTVAVVFEGPEDVLAVPPPASELLVEVGGRTPLELGPLPAVAGTGKLVVPTEVKVSGQMVVDSGTTEVTTEAEPDSGQSETEDAQLSTVT